MKAYVCNYKLNGATSLYVRDILVISPLFDKPGFRLLTSQDTFELYNQSLQNGDLVVLKELELSGDLVSGILNDKREFDEAKERMEEKGRTLINLLLEAEQQPKPSE